MLNNDLRKIDRKTYMLLEWLGDCGGLISALFRLANLIVSPIAAYSIRTKLVTSMVQIQKSDSDREGLGSPFANHKLTDPIFASRVRKITRDYEKTWKLEERGFF